MRGGVAGRGRRGEPPPRGARGSTSTGQYELSKLTQARFIYFTFCEARPGTSRPLLNRNTHTKDEQRCNVRVECWPSYRFAYLLLPLQDVRHGDVFGEVHLTIEHDALSEDSCDVNSILVVLVASYCNSLC